MKSCARSVLDSQPTSYHIAIPARVMFMIELYLTMMGFRVFEANVPHLMSVSSSDAPDSPKPREADGARKRVFISHSQDQTAAPKL